MVDQHCLTGCDLSGKQNKALTVLNSVFGRNLVSLALLCLTERYLSTRAVLCSELLDRGCHNCIRRMWDPPYGTIPNMDEQSEPTQISPIFYDRFKRRFLPAPRATIARTSFFSPRRLPEQSKINRLTYGCCCSCFSGMRRWQVTITSSF